MYTYITTYKFDTGKDGKEPPIYHAYQSYLDAVQAQRDGSQGEGTTSTAYFSHLLCITDLSQEIIRYFQTEGINVKTYKGYVITLICVDIDNDKKIVDMAQIINGILYKMPENVAELFLSSMEKSIRNYIAQIRG